MLKSPKFWFKDKGLLSLLLYPLSFIYAVCDRIVFWRRSKNTFKSSAKVICVGNITVGGSGKTPVVEKLCEFFERDAVSHSVVSRGYGGEKIGPLMVDVQRDSAKDVGDEPLMLAKQGHNVWVGKNRKVTIEHAEDMASVLIMDDGFQNPVVKKDLNILVFDGGVGIGNGLHLPAGPLRETLAHAVKRSDVAIIIGSDKTNLAARIQKENDKLKVFKAFMVPDKNVLRRMQKKRVVAFAGIGRPEKFFSMLRNYGIKLIDSFSFADHKVYSEWELARVMAHRDTASIVTTTKDFVRVPQKFRPYVTSIPATLEFEDEKGFYKFISGQLKL
jgi:tetraacyldisaccharide 4'-kinase